MVFGAFSQKSEFLGGLFPQKSQNPRGQKKSPWAAQNPRGAEIGSIGGQFQTLGINVPNV